MSSVPLKVNDILKESEVEGVIKALVIDDSRLDQLILKKMLLNNRDYNYYYEIKIASNGKMAIELFNEYKPDIVFMDLQLPDTTGYELTKEIKKLSEGEYIPVIFVTGAKDDKSLGACLLSGGDDFIVKPIKASLLKAKTDSLLRVKKMHNDLLLEKKS